MFERGYHIGQRSVFNGHTCLFASVRAFKCASQVIPRRHSRRLDAFSSSRRILDASMRRPCRAAMQQRVRINVAVIKRKTVSTRQTSRHGREHSWISSKLTPNAIGFSLRSFDFINFIIFGKIYFMQ